MFYLILGSIGVGFFVTVVSVWMSLELIFFGS